MKEFRPLFLITYLIFGAAFLIFSCNSTKNLAPEDHTLMITLKDDLSGKYISENYQTYSPSGINKSNKTLNQYEVKFTCNDTKFVKLQEELRNDLSVTKYDNYQNSTNNIQSGKNDESGKSKPIRNDK